VHPHPESRVIRPLHAGDIVALPHLNAVGRYVGDGAASKFEWYVSPSGPLCIGYPPDVASNADTDELDIMVDTGEIVILESNFGSLDAYDVYQSYRDCDPRLVSPGGAPTTSMLEVRAERGRGARERVNGFLKHPAVQYQHDPVTRPFRIALTAVFDDKEVAMAVLGRPTGRHNADGRTLELYRFAAHPGRPPNTGSWLLSRCCRWATLEGYDRLITYAGVQNDNEGTMYRAAGFKHTNTATGDLSAWCSRSGRVGGGTYRKHSYVRHLSDHSLQARRPAGRVDDEQSQLIYRGTLPKAGGSSSRRISQEDLVQTREESPDRRGASLSLDAQELFDQDGTGENRGRNITLAPLVACFGYRTHEDALVAALAVRDDTGEPNPRNNTTAVTLASVAVQTDLLAYPVNALRTLIAGAVEWASLHGYETVETRLEDHVASSALNGLSSPIEIETNPSGTAETDRSQTPSSA